MNPRQRRDDDVLNCRTSMHDGTSPFSLSLSACPVSQPYLFLDTGLRFESAQTQSFMDTQPSYQSHENANAAVTAPGNANMESFLIDDLLDFSNDEDDADIAAPIEKENSASSVTTESDSSPSGSVASADAANSSSLVTDDLPESMLCVPTDTLADLEWLSTFVDESFTVPEFIPYSTEPSSEYMKKKAKEEKKKEERCRFTASSFPVKARSKRSRTGGRVWSLTYPLLVTNPSYFSNAEFFPSGESSESSSSSVGRPPKKQKMKKTAAKKPRVMMEPSSEGSNHPQRKCSHCLVTKTPQWRTGPLGPKTLCNACGVRYKSGRLLPEYRPALSPTFLSHVHSNSHRKILEMRRQKGLPHEQSPHQTLAFLQQNLLQNHRQSLEEQFDDHHDENPLQEIPISQHVAEISHVAEIAPHVTEIAPITPHGVEITHNVAEMIQQVHEIDQSVREKDQKQSAEISHEEMKKEAVKNYEERFLQHTEHHQQPMAVH